MLARAPTRSQRPSIPSPVTGCTSSPSTRRARRCSPATTNSIWRISSWPSATVSSTPRGSRAPRKGGRSRFADRAFALSAAASGRLPRAGTGRLDLRADRVRRRRIARRGRRVRAGVGRRLGDDAGQVRRAAVRRRAHRTRRAGRFGQHPAANAARLARRQHRHRRRDWVRWARRRAGRWCRGLAAPPRRRLWRWPSWASAISPWWPATRTRPRGWWNWRTRVGVATRFCELDSDAGLADAVSAAGVLVSTLPADVAAGMPRRSPARRCCWTRSTTRGRRRWPRR